MVRRTRLGLYLRDEGMKRQVKVAAAKRGMTVTDYCAETIEERLVMNGERKASEGKLRGAEVKVALLSRMDQVRREIGPIGMPASELVEQGRRR